MSPGVLHVIPLLEVMLPGIDVNDESKTMRTMKAIDSVLMHIPLADGTNALTR